jgi:hypothetical protein
VIALEKLRTLDLDQPSRPGRPAHVSAASGLVRAGGNLYVVADDENHLAIFAEAGSAPGTMTRILPGTLPLAHDARKRNKPDFESLVRIPMSGGNAGALFAIGSCSRRERCSGVLLGLDERAHLDGTRSVIDLAPLFEALGGRVGQLGIGLNIEGALVLGDELVLLQRGNKGGGPNARIRLRLDHAIASMRAESRVDIKALVAIDEADLGAIDGVPLCFSDGAALPDGRMAFAAIAEDTADTYLDGPSRGSALGVMDASGRIEFLENLGNEYKVEGVDAAMDGDRIRMLLVTDGDDADIPAALLRAEITA